jgi:hypothetical protein
MKLESYLNERDVAKLPVEDCKGLKGEEKKACKIEKYQEYIKSIKDAIQSSTSDEEKKGMKKSLKFANGVLAKMKGKG